MLISDVGWVGRLQQHVSDYLHCEDTLEAVESQIHPSILEHRPTDNTRHAEGCRSSIHEMKRYPYAIL